MTAPAPHTPGEPYDAEEDARRSYALAINELRRQHIARAVMRDTQREMERAAMKLCGERDTEEGREDVGCLRQASRGGD